MSFSIIPLIIIDVSFSNLVINMKA